MGFLEARKKMIQEQLLARDITDRKVLEAMETVPREKFIPQKERSYAYEDFPLPIGRGQTISQPYIVALMTQLLELKGKERVLEIGTGSGYQTAILAKLAKEIYSIERDEVLAKKAQNLLKKLGFKNVKVIVGDGFLGYRKAAPYQRIILTAAPSVIPPTLIDQLDFGGMLVAPVGGSFNQRLIRVKKEKEGLREEDFGGCAFVPLVEGIARQESL